MVSAPNVSRTTERVARLRQRAQQDAQGAHRQPRPSHWSVSSMACSLAERRAWSLYLACERMPITIEADELIVGTRTLLPPEPEAGAGWLSPLPAYFRDDAERDAVDHGRGASHNVPGFGKLLRCGLDELTARARAGVAVAGEPPQRAALSSFGIVCQAAAVYLNRHALLARQLAATENDDRRRAELVRVAACCSWVAGGVPRDLQEALQLYWAVWSLIVLEVGYLVSMGRVDQWLAPYWPTGPDEQEQAQELLDCFIIKCNDHNALWAGHSLVNNEPVLSGLTASGADGTNPVTWAVLSAVDRLNMPDPQPAVRLHDQSPPALVDEVCRLWLAGRSQLSVYNDDVFVPALAQAGFAADAARSYAIDACQDLTIEGCSDFYCAGSVDLGRLLRDVLAAAPDDADWDLFVDAYRNRITAEVEQVCGRYNESLQSRPGLPCPLLSVTLDDCLETGLDMADGGLAIRAKGIMLAQPVVMINSLAALRRVVFVDRAATLAEVRAGCMSNWQGAAALQRRLRAAPKWGNDDDAVDLPGIAMLRFAAEQIQRWRLPDGSLFLSGVHQAHHVAVGQNLGATPDGRAAGEPLSPTLAPASGSETQGPTAVMRSVAKLDTRTVQWNASLTMVFDPGSLQGAAGQRKFTDLVRTWLRLRGPQLQVNVVDRQTLRAAQAAPDQYQHLIVRVWGFSDRFVSLRPEHQEELINRTAHRL